ncbi:MAG TPA: STAS domain-containing protein [Candidatus Acidoferrales bacterium]|nr:STAS domain-containing protein [Candidatus Acidoferrales bacterium]
MEITQQQHGDTLELAVSGRLDAYWAGHLHDQLSEVLRQGARHVRLNLRQVAYISSAGIRVLLQLHKQIKAIGGTFAVAEPSEAVKTILDLAGLAELLVERVAAREVHVAPSTAFGAWERASARFEVLESAPEATLKGRIIGSPDLLVGCRFGKEDCRELSFDDSTLGVGLGAFGDSFEDCQSRFGEFLAAAGVAAYLPTDGTNVPDYILATGRFVPRLQVLYGVACEGDFSKVVYFEGKENFQPPALHEIVEACRDIAGSDPIAIAMLAESAGLMGAALRRSPALEQSAQAPFAHPQIREWLSFTAERAYARSLALVVGVAASSPSEFDPMLRPLAKSSDIRGHFHAAPFSYRPLKKGETNLKATAAALFEAETLQGVLHLVNDEREISGAGGSRFLRGACWIGPIGQISVEKR